MSKASLYVGPAQDDGKRVVVARFGEHELHRDKFDTDGAFLRQKFCETAIEEFLRHPAASASRVATEEDMQGHNFYGTGRQIFEPSEIVAQAEASDNEALKNSGEQPIRYTKLTCAELAKNVYDLEYLMEGALVRGQPCVIAGPKKALKTSILVDAGISLALAELFLGKIQTKAATVAIMSGESGLATLQETARRIAYAKGIELEDIEKLIFSPDLPQFGNALHTDAMRAFLTENDIEVVFIDPAYLAMPGGDAGNLFLQGELLKSVTKLCDELGVTLCLCHHTKRGINHDQYEPPELEDIAWAGFQEFARQWWLIGRSEKYEPGSGEHRLWLNVGGSAGHSALWGLEVSEGVGHGRRRWDVTLRHAKDVRQDANERADAEKQSKRDQQLKRDATALIRAMAQFPEGETKNVLRDRAGLSGARCNVALATVLQDRRAVLCELFKSGKKTPIEGYKLADDTDKE